MPRTYLLGSQMEIPKEDDLAMARLDNLTALEAALREPQRFLALLISCRDSDEAEAALRSAFGVSQAATAMLDMQFRRVTGEGRDRIGEEAAMLRAQRNA